MPDGWEIYGTPIDAAVEQMRKSTVAAGVTLTRQPDHLGGIMRLSAG